MANPCTGQGVPRLAGETLPAPPPPEAPTTIYFSEVQTHAYCAHESYIITSKQWQLFIEEQSMLSNCLQLWLAW